jgi:nicotinamide riboside kinase
MKSFEHNKTLKVINMLGGPGAGKSSVSHALVSAMRSTGYKAEYVHEYAKECVWSNMGHDSSNSGGIFTEQDWMLAHQNHLLRRLVSRDVEYAVQDTSILLGLAYMPDWYPQSFKQFLLDTFNSYTNINVFVERGDLPYVTEGRNQTAEEALEKDNAVKRLLSDNGVEFFTVSQVVGNPDLVAQQILSQLKLREEVLK